MMDLVIMDVVMFLYIFVYHKSISVYRFGIHRMCCIRFYPRMIAMDCFVALAMTGVFAMTLLVITMSGAKKWSMKSLAMFTRYGLLRCTRNDGCVRNDGYMDCFAMLAMTGAVVYCIGHRCDDIQNSYCIYYYISLMTSYFILILPTKANQITVCTPACLSFLADSLRVAPDHTKSSINNTVW